MYEMCFFFFASSSRCSLSLHPRPSFSLFFFFSLQAFLASLPVYNVRLMDANLPRSHQSVSLSMKHKLRFIFHGIAGVRTGEGRKGGRRRIGRKEEEKGEGVDREFGMQENTRRGGGRKEDRGAGEGGEGGAGTGSLPVYFTVVVL